MADASFEFWDLGACGSEGLGSLMDGEPLLGALSAQVGTFGHWRRVGEQPVDLACDVALEAAHDLAAGVVDAALVAAQPDHGDAPQGVVGEPVAVAVERCGSRCTSGRVPLPNRMYNR